MYWPNCGLFVGCTTQRTVYNIVNMFALPTQVCIVTQCICFAIVQCRKHWFNTLSVADIIRSQYNLQFLLSTSQCAALKMTSLSSNGAVEMGLRKKIVMVRDALLELNINNGRAYSKDDINIALNHYDFDVDRTVQAFLEGKSHYFARTCVNLCLFVFIRRFFVDIWHFCRCLQMPLLISQVHSVLCSFSCDTPLSCESSFLIHDSCSAF